MDFSHHPGIRDPEGEGLTVLSIKLNFKAAYHELGKQVRKVLRSELEEKAKAVLAEARAMVTKGPGASAPGHPFRSHRGVAKRLLKYKVSKSGRDAFVGFKRETAKEDKKTGKKIKPQRVLPNILEHGSRRMAPRPVLEPALERVKDHPWRSML